MSDHRVFNVLFLCTTNCARSLMAECILNRIGEGHFRAWSAGVEPAAEAHPEALKLLGGLSYDTSGLRPKSWTEYARPDAPHFDFVFTVCDDAADETCATLPGEPWHRMSAHWGIPDPKLAHGRGIDIALAFAEAYRLLHQRVSIFAALPVRSLDRLALQEHLEAIGRAELPPQEQAG